MPSFPIARVFLTCAALALAISFTCGATRVVAADFGATTNGAWNNAATWTPTGIPGISDTVYIGSTYPTNSASIATVNLTQNQSAATVFLGYATGDTGTLDLGTSQLTATSLYLGYSGGTGVITRSSGGALSITGAIVLNSGSSLSFATGDATPNLYLWGGSSATTAATSNVTSLVEITGGSTLTLGANLNLGTNGSLTVADGSVNGGGKSIAARYVYLGTSTTSGTLSNYTTLTAENLYVASSTFAFNTGDAISNGLSLANGATVTTSHVGNVAASIEINSGGTLNLGAALNLSNSLDIRNGTVNGNGNAVSAPSIYVGWHGGPATLTGYSSVTATNLYVADQAFNLTTADSVTNFALRGATASTALPTGVSVQSLSLADGAAATTATTGNVTGTVSVYSGSTLALGAALNLSNYLDITNGTVNAGGNPITAASAVYLTGTAGSSVLNGHGTLTTPTLYLTNTTFAFNPTDTVSNSLLLNIGSTATTSHVGNVASYVELNGGSTLNLGAALNLSNSLDIRDGTVNGNGNAVSASSILVGWNGGPGSLTGYSSLTATNLYVADQAFHLTTADTVTNFFLRGGSTALPAGVAVELLGLDQGSTATTSDGGNVTGTVLVYNGSTLTLGAPLNLSNYLDVSNGTVNAGGNPITTTNAVYLTGTGGSSVLNGHGTLTTQNLYLTSTTFTFNPTDTVSGTLSLATGSTATTSHVGNAASYVEVGGGSTLNLGAALNLSNTLDIRNGTVNGNGNAVSALTVLVGWHAGPGTLTGYSSLTATNLYVADQAFHLTAADSVTNFSLRGATASTALPTGVSVESLNLTDGATATTATTGNLTGTVVVHNGSTLTLGAALNLSNYLDVSNGTVNAAGNAITTASAVYLAGTGGSSVLNGHGTLTTPNLYLTSTTFTFNPADAVSNNLSLNTGTTATTSHVGNVTGYVEVSGGSTLILGAPLNVGTNTFDIRNGTLNAQGRAITAGTVVFGYNGSAAAAIQNLGPVTTTNWYQGNGTAVTVQEGAVMADALILRGGAVLTVKPLSTVEGLTLNRTDDGAIDIADTGTKIVIEIDGNRNSYVFRWANPSGEDHIQDLNDLIAAGRIQFTYINGGQLTIGADANYTYILQPVPEPTTVLAVGTAGLAVAGLIRKRRRAGQPVAG